MAKYLLVVLHQTSLYTEHSVKETGGSHSALLIDNQPSTPYFSKTKMEELHTDSSSTLNFAKYLLQCGTVELPFRSCECYVNILSTARLLMAAAE